MDFKNDRIYIIYTACICTTAVFFGRDGGKRQQRREQKDTVHGFREKPNDKKYMVKRRKRGHATE